MSEDGNSSREISDSPTTKHFLIIFSRSSGSILRLQAFDDSTLAVRERFKAEDEYESDEVECVVLTADSESDLLRTHGRYFQSLRDLIEGPGAAGSGHREG